MLNFVTRFYHIGKKFLLGFLYLLHCLSPWKRKVWIIASPSHGNLGDSAIIVAEIKMLTTLDIPQKCIKEISLREYKKYRKWLVRFVGLKDIVTSPGGGNMGDVWFEEEKCRRAALADFPHNPFILFPHTIFYSQTENGNKEEKASIPFYNDGRKLLVAREAVSFQKFQKLYPAANSLLTPDIVLSMTAADFEILPQKRDGILLCLRKDCEKSLSSDGVRRLEKVAGKSSSSVRFTDTVLEHDVTPANRFHYVREKMLELASAELVVTDRLHGMVFATITGTPCVVLGNNNHKVRSTYEWIKYLPYVKFADSIDEAERHIPKLCQMQNCVFDNAPLMPYFDKLKACILEIMHDQ